MIASPNFWRSPNRSSRDFERAVETGLLGCDAKHVQSVSRLRQTRLGFLRRRLGLFETLSRLQPQGGFFARPRQPVTQASNGGVDRTRRNVAGAKSQQGVEALFELRHVGGDFPGAQKLFGLVIGLIGQVPPQGDAFLCFVEGRVVVEPQRDEGGAPFFAPTALFAGYYSEPLFPLGDAVRRVGDFRLRLARRVLRLGEFDQARLDPPRQRRAIESFERR